MRRWIPGVLAVVTAVPLLAALGVAGAPGASAENNGVGRTPAMGWSSWSFIRHDPTAAKIEAQARAMKASGLAAVGYQYVNIDDFWYVCPGSQGPDVDKYGRWVINSTEFPTRNGVSGIAAVAKYAHSLGLKFGLYVTPGISKQAVAQNTAIKGTSDTADQIAEPSVAENNYNCGGMVGIDYSKPGAQAFINSWADEFAAWGVDYVKLDGVGSFDIPDVAAWSKALRQTGRPIHLELSNNLDISDAATWAKYTNGWRTGGDIECYCGPTSYPLTDWSNVESRFDQVAAWQPYGGPGAFNDYDSIEVGNGANDGLTPAQRQTQLSLWALASSPLILGTDLTHLSPLDLRYLKNKAVIAVDQDSIDASRVVDSGGEQVFAKTEKNGDVVAGLFNTTGAAAPESVAASALGLPAATSYTLGNLWTGQTTESAGTISADVPADGVALLRITPAQHPGGAPPDGTAALAGLAGLTAGQPATATASFSNDGAQPVRRLTLRLATPAGWTVTPTSRTHFASVGSGGTAQATFAVTAPAPAAPLASGTVSARAAYRWKASTERASVSEPVTVSAPVQPPQQTYSSATDAPAAFGQLGSRFAISGAGADLWTDADAYSAIYQPGVVSGSSTVQTEVTSQQNMTGYAKAGLIVRNDMTGSGSTPEGVILFESPSGGIQFEWDSNGDSIDSVTPPNGTIPDTLPVWLKLVRNGAVYTGYYSTDGSTWQTVGSATVPGQAATQDAGMFVTSHTTGSPGEASFDGFSVS
ncbi:MAG TPA: NEW3 domain-containing protein [Streptosporangiaceae bacterium]|jgi:hypothetical protein